MSKVVLILAATSVGLGALSVHLVKQLRDGQGTIAQLQVQVTKLEEQQQRDRAELAAALAPPVRSIPVPIGDGATISGATAPVAPRPTVALRSSAGPTAVDQPQVPNREERMRMVREGRERQRQLMQDPEYREALRVQNRSNFGRSYPGVADELGFDPQQTDEFFGLLSDQQMRATEALEPMWDMEGKDPALLQEQQRKVQQQAAELQRKGEAEIAAKFGQEKLQAWKDYQSTLGARHNAEQMRNTLASQGMPLSEDASKSMIKAIAEAQQAEATEYGAAMSRGAGPALLMAGRVGSPGFSEETIERQLEATKKRNQRTLDAISPYLSYEQRQAIEKEQDAQLKLQQAHMRLMRSQNNNGNAVFATGSAQGVLVPLQ